MRSTHFKLPPTSANNAYEAYESLQNLRSKNKKFQVDRDGRLRQRKTKDTKALKLPPHFL